MRLEGEVTWFNEQKGFGFITGDDGLDVLSIIPRSFGTVSNLEPGERVSYTLTDVEVGPKAVDVRLTADGAHASLI